MTFTARLPRRTVLVLGLLALANPAMVSPAVAQTQNNLVDLQVINRDTGEVLRTWRHDGRLYVAGDPGTRYGLRFSNHTGGRVLVVASVDGVNIITGETANYNERGYVLYPWQTTEVDGWRKSETAIAAFQFAPLSGSYAARTGRPGDVGVIGMAVFRERAPLPAPPPVVSMDRPAPSVLPDMARSAPMPAPAPSMALAPPPPPAAPSQSMARADEKLGTAHGASEWSAIDMVRFIRATAEPEAISTIEYDTWDHLVAHGVIAFTLPRHPQAFPGEPRLGYVPDPPA